METEIKMFSLLHKVFNCVSKKIQCLQYKQGFRILGIKII
jgi:hypothetical protein